MFDLEVKMSDFILLRIEFMQNHEELCPSNVDLQSWMSILDTMYEGFTYLSKDEWDRTPAERDIVEDALDLFREHFEDLEM